mmetsp:Transcript_31203/g.43246  ORF Transcript_31203/g.43246 Transcript_31203/m.43246 type:complete len:752 (+) Transcript_31203:112-2367(+)
MEGYLKKRRTTKWPHLWQQRWVTLKGNILSWSNDQHSECLGSLVLDGIEWTTSGSSPTELCFKAFQTNKQRYREFVFRASGESECAAWKEKLKSLHQAPAICPPSHLSLRIQTLSVAVLERGNGWGSEDCGIGDERSARVGDKLLISVRTSLPILPPSILVGSWFGEVAIPVEGQGDTWTAHLELIPGRGQEERSLTFRVVCMTMAGEQVESSVPIDEGEECPSNSVLCDMREWWTDTEPRVQKPHLNASNRPQDPVSPMLSATSRSSKEKRSGKTDEKKQIEEDFRTPMKYNENEGEERPGEEEEFRTPEVDQDFCQQFEEVLRPSQPSGRACRKFTVLEINSLRMESNNPQSRKFARAGDTVTLRLVTSTEVLQPSFYVGTQLCHYVYVESESFVTYDVDNRPLSKEWWAEVELKDGNQAPGPLTLRVLGIQDEAGTSLPPVHYLVCPSQEESSKTWLPQGDSAWELACEDTKEVHFFSGLPNIVDVQCRLQRADGDLDQCGYGAEAGDEVTVDVIFDRMVRGVSTSIVECGAKSLPVHTNARWGSTDSHSCDAGSTRGFKLVNRKSHIPLDAEYCVVAGYEYSTRWSSNYVIGEGILELDKNTGRVPVLVREGFWDLAGNYGKELRVPKKSWPIGIKRKRFLVVEKDPMEGIEVRVALGVEWKVWGSDFIKVDIVVEEINLELCQKEVLLSGIVVVYLEVRINVRKTLFSSERVMRDATKTFTKHAVEEFQRKEEKYGRLLGWLKLRF